MSLNTLPLEIRTRIWRLLLTRPCPIHICYENKRAANLKLKGSCRIEPPSGYKSSCDFLERERYALSISNGPWRVYECAGPMFTLSVLLVCQTIYMETVSILYKENKFILYATSVKDVPVGFDFAGIRSLHIDTWCLKSDAQSLEDYRNMIRTIRLHPETRLSFAARYTNSQDLTKVIQRLGPVKSCALLLRNSPHAKRVAKMLMGDQEEPLFPLYSKLPVELRCHVLSFTGLVQKYQLHGNRICCKTECCRRCSESLFGCYCVKFPMQHSSVTSEGTHFIDDRFSETCQCKHDPLALLKVSPEFQQEALRVLFIHSSFTFYDASPTTLRFFQRISHHLRLLRKIELRLAPEDFIEEENGKLDWEKFIDYIEPRLSFPLLQLTIMADYLFREDKSHPDPDAIMPDGKATRDLWQAFIPSLQRLVAKGLTNFFFVLEDWDEFEDEFEHKVLGERIINRKSWR